MSIITPRSLALATVARQAPQIINTIAGVKSLVTREIITPQAFAFRSINRLLREFPSLGRAGAGVLLGTITQANRAGAELFARLGDPILAAERAPNVPLLGMDSPSPTFYWYSTAVQLESPDGTLTSVIPVTVDSVTPLSIADIIERVLPDMARRFRQEESQPNLASVDEVLESSVIFIGDGHILKRVPA